MRLVFIRSWHHMSDQPDNNNIIVGTIQHKILKHGMKFNTGVGTLPCQTRLTSLPMISRPPVKKCNPPLKFRGKGKGKGKGKKNTTNYHQPPPFSKKEKKKKVESSEDLPVFQTEEVEA